MLQFLSYTWQYNCIFCIKSKHVDKSFRITQISLKRWLTDIVVWLNNINLNVSLQFNWLIYIFVLFFFPFIFFFRAILLSSTKSIELKIWTLNYKRNSVLFICLVYLRFLGVFFGRGVFVCFCLLFFFFCLFLHFVGFFVGFLFV